MYIFVFSLVSNSMRACHFTNTSAILTLLALKILVCNCSGARAEGTRNAQRKQFNLINLLGSRLAGGNGTWLLRSSYKLLISYFANILL